MSAAVHVLRTMRDVVEERLRDRLGTQRSRGLVVTEGDGVVYVGCPGRWVAWLVSRQLHGFQWTQDGTLFEVRGFAPLPGDLIDLGEG